ncbi:MAG: hypothetical protein WBO45_18825, partial [Planctomycetota bacterium]
YVGFVTDPALGSVGGFAVSRWGFLDDQEPLRHGGGDRWIVGVVGGSMALQLTLFAGDELQAALARSTALAGRRIELVRLGVGGWKQPQTLLLVQLLLLLGGHFDCIVVLDGFNEVALAGENVPRGVPAWFPRGWTGLTGGVASPTQQRRLGHLAVLTEERMEWCGFAEALWWSPAAQFVWTWRDRALAARIAALRQRADAAATAPSSAATGPGAGDGDLVAARAQMVELWQRASRDLHALCQRHGIRYFHFLQPNQYVAGSKPIGAEEARVALAPEHPYAVAVQDGYPRLRAAGAALRAEGVPFVDLTGILAEHPEPLWVDTCCHLGRAGNLILADHVAATVRAELDLTGFVLQGLRVEPERLVLRSPLASVLVRVWGRDAAGREVDLSGHAIGTRLVAAPPDLLQIAPDGSVRGTRRGSGSLRVGHGAHAAELSVSVDWPDVVSGGDGAGGGPGGVPVLAVVDGEPAAGVTIQCSGLPADGLRVLVQADFPLPAAPPAGASAYGWSAQPLAPGDAPRLAVRPGLPPGRPWFLRAYCVAADTGLVMAASNTLVLTGR